MALITGKGVRLPSAHSDAFVSVPHSSSSSAMLAIRSVSAEMRSISSTPRVEPIRLEPGQVFSREDFQLMQALNHLKGQPVLRELPPPATSASAAPAAASAAAR